MLAVFERFSFLYTVSKMCKWVFPEDHPFSRFISDFLLLHKVYTSLIIHVWFKYYCPALRILIVLLVFILGSGMVLLREKVVPRIATDWNMVADYLGFEEEDKRLIGEKFHHDPIKCCEQLLEDWVSGDKGVSPKSWTKLIEVLRKSEGLVAVIEEIVEDLAVAGVSM